jgi:hypothetical protein
MTQHRPKAPTNLTMALLLALIATPLTVNQRGGFGLNQASAQTGHSGGNAGHSVSRAEPGEGSAKDKAADARQAKLDAAISNVLDKKLQKLEAKELTRPNPIIEGLEVEVQETLNTVNHPEQ